jgi:CubicO group peptidase (beta-lactamase class C family)
LEAPLSLLTACRQVDAAIRSRAPYAHTSHFRVEVDGEVVFDRHYRGPRVADVFSVTKSVVATLAGIAARDGHLDDLDLPAGRVLDLAGTPAAGHTPRQLLTMTRGCQVDGPYEIDEVMALPGGWLARIAAAPQLDPPGRSFRYDNGAAHLFGAVLSRLVGMPLAGYAERCLFAPLAITDWHWPLDPDGFHYGAGHLRLAAADLAKLGRLWTDAGGWAGQQVAVVPAARAVIVTTGDPRFELGPPPTDQLPPGWRPAGELVVERLLPVLRRSPGQGTASG